MKKKIILLVLSLMVIATGVSASSFNGEYKGNPIVKLKSNGSLVDTGEVPAMIYDGKTMVPISALRNLGVDVTWDPNTYSVDVTLPTSKDSKNTEDYMILSKYTEILRGIYAFEEQYALISVIAMGIVPNVSTNEQYTTLMDTLSRVNTESLNNWVNQFINIGMSSKNTDDLSKAISYLVTAKENLKNLDSTKGTQNINSSRTLFNPIAQNIDVLARDAIKLK